MVSFAVYGSDPYGLNFSGNKGFNIQYKSVELYIKKVTLSYEPATKADEDIIKRYGDVFSVPAYLVKMVPVLKIDGNVVARGNEIGLGYRQQFEIGIKSTGREKEIINNDVIAGSFYNVGFDYQIVSEDELQTISDRLKDSEYTARNIYTDEKLGEILNFVAKSYFMEMDLINKMLSQQMEVSNVRLLSEGITGFKANVKYLFSVPVELSNGGLYIDVDSNINSVVSRNGDKEVERQYMVASGMISSALEHSIWEQATGIESVSTIKVLEVAAEREIPIYIITKENYSEYDEKLKLSTSVKGEIRNAVNGGKVVTVASEEITLGDWTGAGYIVMDPETGSAGYMISGGLAGGATSIWIFLATLANIGFAVWDFVEAIQLIEAGIGLLALGPLGIALGIVVILLGVISLIFAIISIINTIDLWIKYYNGDAEAGEEILGDVALNAILALATFGIGQAVKPIAKSLKKAKAVKALGEEVVEQMVKNGDSYDDILDMLKALKKAGVSDDVAKDIAERFGKEGLDLARECGDDAVKAMKKGIDPDTIKKLKDLGIDPSDYDNMGIDNLDDAKAAIRRAGSGIDNRVKPSRNPDLLAKPGGKRTVVNYNDPDPDNIRALIRENEAADTLARHGYVVEQNPKVPGSKNPDYLIEGEIFDCYSPKDGTSVRNIASAIQRKIDEGQANRIILNLDDWHGGGGNIDDLISQLNDWPIEGLIEVKVINHYHQVIDIYP